LKNNGDGIFQAADNYWAGDSPLSVFAADFDGDGDYDLATANSGSDDVSILINLLLLDNINSCSYTPGDVNSDEGVNLADLVYFVKQVRRQVEFKDVCDCRPAVSEYPFYATADVNGTCEVDLADLIWFVKWVRKQVEIRYCLDCPPITGGELLSIEADRSSRPNFAK
jgi:hypothetical protein